MSGTLNSGRTPKTRVSKMLNKSISTVTADLLFKKYTGVSAKGLPKSKPNITSFTQDLPAKDRKKESLQGLNRMDFQTFVLAMSEISYQIYSKFFDEDNGTKTEAQCFLTLINDNLLPLDDSIQQTEKGNYSQAQIMQLMEILKDDKIVDLLGCVHKAMMPYFSFYSDPKSELLGFEGF